jgi:nitrous oxidase accessory protein NosD
MKALGTLGMLVVLVTMASPALGGTHQVNCDVPGQSITKALTTAEPGDTIRVQGTCEETVTITTDQLTLHGIDNATLKGPGGRPSGEVFEGLLNVVGAQGVEIRGFTVQDSPVHGINGRQGAALVVRDTRVLQSGAAGIQVTETSTVRFLGTCEVRGNSNAGITIRRGSSALFLADLVHATHNTWGILVLGHSSLALAGETSTILAEENTLDGMIVADTSDLRLDGGKITSSRNGSSGLIIGGGANLTLFAGTILLENNPAGLVLDVGSTMAVFPTGHLTIQGNTTVGLSADNRSTMRVIEGATITGNSTDVVLLFGSLATFIGNTIGTITCDETVLLRGDTGVTCPNP